MTGYMFCSSRHSHDWHNPSREEGWPRYPVCFAGSWERNRYPERANALRHLLDPALPLGLHIFDRYLTRRDLGPNYRFPNQYKEAIRGTLPYREMLTAIAAMTRC